MAKDLIDELEEILDKRRQYLSWNCNRVHFLADVMVEVNPSYGKDGEIEEYLESKNLTEFKDKWFNFARPCNKDWHYVRAENELYGLAEYLDKAGDEIDKHDVPLISYEITDENQCLITCYVRKDLDLDSKRTVRGSWETKEITIKEILKDWLEGQISDGWGENGAFVYHWMGEQPLLATIENLREVEKKWNTETGEKYWEDVK